MKQRIKLFVFSEALQATILKKLDEKDNDSIIVSVYGYTPDEKAHIEFNYPIQFHNEKDRDLTFEEITQEKLLEDIQTIIISNKIPIKTS